MDLINLFPEGHAVIVTKTNHNDYRKIGIAKDKIDSYWINVDFGTHKAKHRFVNLTDLTFKYS